MSFDWSGLASGINTGLDLADGAIKTYNDFKTGLNSAGGASTTTGAKPTTTVIYKPAPGAPQTDYKKYIMYGVAGVIAVVAIFLVVKK